MERDHRDVCFHIPFSLDDVDEALHHEEVKNALQEEDRELLFHISGPLRREEL